MCGAIEAWAGLLIGKVTTEDKSDWGGGGRNLADQKIGNNGLTKTKLVTPYHIEKKMK